MVRRGETCVSTRTLLLVQRRMRYLPDSHHFYKTLYKIFIGKQRYILHRKQLTEIIRLCSCIYSLSCSTSLHRRHHMHTSSSHLNLVDIWHVKVTDVAMTRRHKNSGKILSSHSCDVAERINHCLD